MLNCDRVKISSTFYFTEKKLCKSDLLIRKDAHCSENNFLVQEFFFVWLLVFEIWSTIYKINHIAKTKSQKYDLGWWSSLANVEYKIDYISKTRSRTKKNSFTQKSVSEQRASFETWSTIHKINHIAKTKSQKYD